MSLNYNKIKDNQNDGSQWSSYSDLFMVLSLVFLLLYVTSSLRSGTFSLQKNIQFQQLQAERSALKKEQAVYETLKDEYLDTKASETEVETYKELMSKLDLLQDEAQKEKVNLRAQALENEKKEKALNKYQQIIRNIINVNLLAKAGIKDRDVKLERKRQQIVEKENTIEKQLGEIKERDEIIDQKEHIIQDKQEEIEKSEDIIAEKKRILRAKNQELEELSLLIAEKKRIIEENNKQIDSINNTLAKKINALKNARKQKKISSAKLKRQIENLKKTSEQKIASLESKNHSMSKQLNVANTDLTNINKQLATATKVINTQKQEKAELTGELEKANALYNKEIKELKGNFAQELEKRKAEFDSALSKEKSSAAEKAEKQKAFADQVKKDKQDLEKQLSALAQKAKENQEKLEQARNDNSKFKDYINTLENQQTELKKDLDNVKKSRNDRRRLTKSIKDDFRRSGIDAKVDSKTGDVLLTFNDEYFDTGKYTLKEGMKKILRKFMPVYSKSLFKNKKIAKKISSVEIVGFASPTYRGKYVDPKSLAPEDRAAVNYNLDLSYNRAREIFRYIFDKEKFTYQYQSDLLPKIKVTGRSFLAEGVSGAGAEKGLDVKYYCKQYNCKKEQKVIIKFNLND
ncbi:MAG: hypothetical protein R3B45_14685 [Bdellovibrionota bacterium]